MPDDSYKFYSGILPAERVHQAMEALPDVFRGLLGDCIVTAYYGFGCELHPDLQYKPMQVGTKWIHRFITDSITQGIVIPGHSDFSFTAPNERLEILYCHESDIHLSGKDDPLIEQFIATQAFSSIRFRTRAEIEANGMKPPH
jgi:hypothetical protein